jgi:hypothetical protein
MTLANEAHERFAQARFTGQTLAEAYRAAGLSSVTSAEQDAVAKVKIAASRLARQPEVQERIAELYRERAAEAVYEKTSAVRDLLAIIHTSPADAEEAGAEHPLCEVRIGKDGTYHRFPPKLQAMARLIKLMNWDAVVRPPRADGADLPDEERRDTLRDWLAAERSGRLRGVSRAEEEAECGEREGPRDVEWVIARMKLQIYGSAGEPASRGQPSMVNGSAEPSSFGSTLQPFNRSTTLSPKQESFAMARAKGLGVMAAYEAAGYEGGSANLAWRLHQMPAVRARIAELNGSVEAVTGYGKDDAVRDLVAIVHARPNEAGPDHPLCEVR